MNSFYARELAMSFALKLDRTENVDEVIADAEKIYQFLNKDT